MKYFSTFSGIGGFENGILANFPDAQCVGYSEIDKFAIQAYESHFPTHKNYGDITQIDIPNLPDFDLLVGGPPCQDLSIAKKDRQGLSGSRSGLFWKFVEILRIKKPKWFLMENVNSMPKEAKQTITETLRVEPIMINASLVSAQNRKRLFWTNIPNVEQPEDRGILLKDILENGDCDRLKSYCIDANYYKGASLKTYVEKSKRQLVFLGGLQRKDWAGDGKQLSRNYPQGNRVYSPEGKSTTLASNGGGLGAKTGLYLIAPNGKKIIPTDSELQVFVEGRTEEGKKSRREIRQQTGKDSTLRSKEHKAYFGREGNKANCITTGLGMEGVIAENQIIRKLTPVECARLQCFPDEWCSMLSNTQQYKCYGNAVNVEVIKHIVSYLK
jgi:DNA (cytosine-5)-methyltransferase 3A